MAFAMTRKHLFLRLGDQLLRMAVVLAKDQSHSGRPASMGPDNRSSERYASRTCVGNKPPKPIVKEARETYRTSVPDPVGHVIRPDSKAGQQASKDAEGLCPRVLRI